MPGSFTDSCLVCLYLLPHLIVHIIYFLAQILNALAVFQLGKIREHSLVILQLLVQQLKGALVRGSVGNVFKVLFAMSGRHRKLIHFSAFSLCSALAGMTQQSIQ